MAVVFPRDAMTLGFYGVDAKPRLRGVRLPSARFGMDTAGS